MRGNGLLRRQKVSVVSGNELRDACLKDSTSSTARRCSSPSSRTPRSAWQFHPEANLGKPLGVVLDERVISVANIQGRITDNGQIYGISREEMADLVITLKSGALPAS